MLKLSVARYLRIIYALSIWTIKLQNMLGRALCDAAFSVDTRGIKVYHPESITIGKNFSSGRGLWLESVNGKGDLKIGDDVNFSDNVHIACANAVLIGNGVLVGSKSLITDHSHGSGKSMAQNDFSIPPNQRQILSKGHVVIGARVLLGDGVCILGGVVVGEEAIIGANSVVVCDVPARTIWAGVPARQVWPKS